MGQLTLFPRSRVRTTAPEPVEEVLLVGVGRELDLAAVPDALVRVSDTLAMRYLAEWELQAAGLEPTVWVPIQLSSHPDRRVIATTLDGEVIEQDPAGALYGAGDRRVGFGSLISYCGLRSQEEQQLSLGERAGWLLARFEEGSFVLSVHVSEPLLWVYASPHAFGAIGVFGGWITAASQLLSESAARLGRGNKGIAGQSPPADPVIAR